jgi:hypothetical protein
MVFVTECPYRNRGYQEMDRLMWMTGLRSSWFRLLVTILFAVKLH